MEKKKINLDYLKQSYPNKTFPETYDEYLKDIFTKAKEKSVNVEGMEHPCPDCYGAGGTIYTFFNNAFIECFTCKGKCCFSKESSEIMYNARLYCFQKILDDIDGINLTIDDIVKKLSGYELDILDEVIKKAHYKGNIKDYIISEEIGI